MSSQKSLGPRVFGSILFAVFFPLAIGLFGAWMVITSLPDVMDPPTEKMEQKGDDESPQWMAILYQMESGLKDVLLAYRVEDIAEAKAAFEQLGGTLEASLRRTSDSENALNALSGWNEQAQALIKEVEAGNRQAGQTRLSDAAATARLALASELKTLTTARVDTVVPVESKNTDVIAHVTQEFAPYGLGMLCALLGSVLLTRGLLKRAVHQPMLHVAKDLTGIVDGQAFDEDLGAVTDSTVRSLIQRISDRQGRTNQVLQEHKESMEAACYAMVKTATDQREASAQQSSVGTSTQASMSALLASANEVAEVSQRVFTNAETTQHSTQALTQTFDVVSEKITQFQRLVPLMKELSNHADLLALNAALEGTKAGKEGRRFAYIAGRMQRVADQFSEHIRALEHISDETMRSVETGAESVRGAMETVKENTFSARRISLAVQQQREGTEQVLSNIQELMALTEREVDASHQVVAAADAVNQLSEALNQAMMGIDT